MWFRVKGFRIMEKKKWELLCRFQGLGGLGFGGLGFMHLGFSV